MSRENEQLQGGETRYLHNLIIVLLAIYISEVTDEYSAAMTRLDLMQGPTTSPHFLSDRDIAFANSLIS